MKDLILIITSVIITSSLITSLNEFKHVSSELKRVEYINMLQHPNHSQDKLVNEFEQTLTDEELVEILGL